MQNYQLTIFAAGGKRIERKITAPTRLAAMLTGINTLPKDEQPTCIICKTHREACLEERQVA